MTKPRRGSAGSALDDLSEGQPYQPSFFEHEVGGELLNILSKGLYTNPLDAIREYVQNAIDADADTVKIHVTGNSVFVSDDGTGMNRERLLQAKQFGVSLKSIEENVGFRGIGIYSGFDLCERLVIRTKIASDDIEHLLVFKFGEMRRQLDKARQDPKRPAVPLSLLLSSGIYYYYEKSSRKNESFSVVQLEELSDEHIHKLSEVESMRKYILRNLPIRFSRDFKYGKQIESALRKKIPGYKAATVILQIEDSGPIKVEKPNIPDLEPPEMGYIKDTSNKPIAYYWACLTSTSEAISSSRKDLADFAGFVYKVKGFTIGDRNYLMSHFTRKQIYPWWTGEIYVITTQVIPTSARDEFEAGLARDSLETAVKNELRRLQKVALDAQAERRADEIVDKVREGFLDIRDKIKGGDYDKYDAFATLSSMRDKLDDHKNKSSDKQTAKKLARDIDTLLEWIQKGLDKRIPVSTLKRAATKLALREDSQDISEAYGLSNTGLTKAQNSLVVVKLIDAVERTGWILDENSRSLTVLIGEVLLANLGSNNEIYNNLMEDIEAGLMDIMGTR